MFGVLVLLHQSIWSARCSSPTNSEYLVIEYVFCYDLIVSELFKALLLGSQSTLSGLFKAFLPPFQNGWSVRTSVTTSEYLAFSELLSHQTRIFGLEEIHPTISEYLVCSKSSPIYQYIWSNRTSPTTMKHWIVSRLFFSHPRLSGLFQVFRLVHQSFWYGKNSYSIISEYLASSKL